MLAACLMLLTLAQAQDGSSPSNAQANPVPAVSQQTPVRSLDDIPKRNRQEIYEEIHRAGMLASYETAAKFPNGSDANLNPDQQLQFKADRKKFLDAAKQKNFAEVAKRFELTSDQLERIDRQGFKEVWPTHPVDNPFKTSKTKPAAAKPAAAPKPATPAEAKPPAAPKPATPAEAKPPAAPPPATPAEAKPAAAPKPATPAEAKPPAAPKPVSLVAPKPTAARDTKAVTAPLPVKPTQFTPPVINTPPITAEPEPVLVKESKPAANSRPKPMADNAKPADILRKP